jgi:hypothetical protein
MPIHVTLQYVLTINSLGHVSIARARTTRHSFESQCSRHVRRFTFVLTTGFRNMAPEKACSCFPYKWIRFSFAFVWHIPERTSGREPDDVWVSEWYLWESWTWSKIIIYTLTYFINKSFMYRQAFGPIYLLTGHVECMREIMNSYLILKSTTFWGIMPCSPLNVNWRFGRTYRLHLQVRRISRATNQLGLFFDPEDRGDIFLRNVGWHSTDCMALYPRR